MIKSTQNLNSHTPIVAVTSYESFVSEQGTLFAAVLAKPVSKADVLGVLKKLGFVAKMSGGKEGKETRDRADSKSGASGAGTSKEVEGKPLPDSPRQRFPDSPR